MNKVKSVALFACVFALLALQVSEAKAADWKTIDNVDNDSWRAYDVSRTMVVGPRTLGTWKRYQAAGLADKYAGCEYSVTRWEIDCAGKRQRILASFDYDANGKIVNTEVWTDSPFRPIPPDSRGDVEATFICAKSIQGKK
jgi:hypothetical protein